MKNTKAMTLGINMVIVIVVALIILLVGSQFFLGGFGASAGGIGEISTETTTEAESGRFGEGLTGATRAWECIEYKCNPTPNTDIVCVQGDGNEIVKTTCANGCITDPDDDTGVCCSNGAVDPDPLACTGTTYTPSD